MTEWWKNENLCLDKVREEFHSKFGSHSFIDAFDGQEQERIIQAVKSQIILDCRDDTEEGQVFTKIADKLTAHLQQYITPATPAPDSESQEVDIRYIDDAIDQAFGKYRLLPHTNDFELRSTIIEDCVQRMQTLIDSGHMSLEEERHIITSEIETNLKDNVVEKTDIEIEFKPSQEKIKNLALLK